MKCDQITLHVYKVYFIHRNEGGKTEGYVGWLFLSIRLSFSCSHLNHPPPLSLCLICPFCLHIFALVSVRATVCICVCGSMCCSCLCAHVRVCLAWTANSFCQKMSCSKNLELRKCTPLCRYVTRCQIGRAATFD